MIWNPNCFSAYTLTIGPQKKYTCAPLLSGSSVAMGEKIYMLVGAQGDGTIYYVGQTMKSIPSRFYNGFRIGKYSWAMENSKYTLLVWDLQAVLSGSAHLEAVEAELVFAARIAQCAWPKCQNGIHFRHIVNAKGYQLAPYFAIEMISQYYDDLQKRNSALGASNINFMAEKESLITQLKSLILPGT